jgi:EAL domain-containing protein (putative c-di-GMP-specific phosphodiesterase class I)
VKQLSIWKETERSGLSISVNMSAKDLFSIDVYDVLTKLIEKYGVDSSALRLEITETALLVDPEKSDAVISRLRQRGFIIEIDDFGKGYSSLGLLKNITADVIKIDMSFLQETRDNERNALILRSVIGLSDSLGMDVITEGVETQQQLQVLTEMGCNLFQGYYFSRPLPVDIFEKEIAV